MQKVLFPLKMEHQRGLHQQGSERDSWILQSCYRSSFEVTLNECDLPSSFERVTSEWLRNSVLAFSRMPDPVCMIVSMPDFRSPWSFCVAASASVDRFQRSGNMEILIKPKKISTLSRDGYSGYSSEPLFEAYNWMRWSVSALGLGSVAAP
jgi:hypothetical protein